MAVIGALLRALAEVEDELTQAMAVLAEVGVADPGGLTLGEGDRVLLSAARSVTGSDLWLTVTCPACATVNRVVVSAEAVPPADRRSAWWGPGGGLREPTYADLAELPGDPERALAELLRRCTVGAPPRPASVAELELVDQSLTPLALGCAECGCLVEAPLDTQRLVLERLAQWAESVDGEVHLLASTYHWDLASIEALPDERRRRLARHVAEHR